MQIVHFTPPELARRLGVNESTIKRWIDKGILQAERTHGGHRRVSEAHLQQFIKNNPRLGAKSYHISRWHRTATEGWQRYYDLHKSGSHAKAHEYIETRYIVRGSIQSILEEVVAPALREIGAAWHRGELDIVDEHRMSFYIRSDLLALHALLPQPPRSAPRILLACVPGENHELSLVFLSLLAQSLGWQPVVLGINVPMSQIIGAAQDVHVRAVALTKIYSSTSTVGMCDDLTSIRKAIPERVAILAGGSGWSDAERACWQAASGIIGLVTRADFLAALKSVPRA